jgi:hypothetical protein
MKLAKSKEMSRRLKAHWWTRRNRIFLVGAAALVMVLLMGFALARHTVRRGWPQSEGVLTVVGLDAPVTVVRDHYGVPHIYAGSETDLFFAQGYVHAQDRFWQMELERRRGRGTLAALLGEGAQASDERWRNLDLAGVAARELAEMDAATRTPLDAYAAGVNAWLGNPQGRLPFEFTLTRWRGRAAGDPAPWSAEDSLIVSLALGWQAGAPRVDPSLAARIVERVGPERGAFLLGGESGEASLQAPTGVTDTLGVERSGDTGWRRSHPEWGAIVRRRPAHRPGPARAMVRDGMARGSRRGCWRVGARPTWPAGRHRRWGRVGGVVGDAGTGAARGDAAVEAVAAGCSAECGGNCPG